MRRVSQLRRALPPVVALLAFAEAIAPVNAANIRVQRNTGFDVTLTDNLNLEPDDQADSALILSPFVGFNAQGDGDRVDFAFNYRLTLDTILSKDNDVNIRNDFIGFGSAELIEDMLFVDVNGLASQPLIDPGGRTSTSPSVGRESRTQVAAGSFSPYLLNNFGDIAESELRYRYSYTFVGRDQIGDSTTNFGLARLSTGRMFTAVKLDAIAEAEVTDAEDETGDIDRTTFRLNGQYPVMRQLSLLGSVGYETIDANSLNDDPDGPLWYVGFFTRPGPRTELRLTYGERYEEPDINGALTYRITPRLTFQASYTHVLETTQRQLSGFLPDLNERDGQVELVDPVTGVLIDITEPVVGLDSGLATEAYTANRFQSSLVGNYERNTVSLVGSHEEREYDIRPNERYISARLGWTRRLSPYTNLFAGVGWRRTEIDGDTTTPSTGTLFGTTAPESDTYSGRIALLQTLAKDVFGNVSFGHTTRVADRTSDEYTENSLTFGVRIVF
jgi:uncharacterized protein (PEP-CTERM system associated)